MICTLDFHLWEISVSYTMLYNAQTNLSTSAFGHQLADSAHSSNEAATIIAKKESMMSHCTLRSIFVIVLYIELMLPAGAECYEMCREYKVLWMNHV